MYVFLGDASAWAIARSYVQQLFCGGNFRKRTSWCICRIQGTGSESEEWRLTKDKGRVEFEMITATKVELARVELKW